MAHVTPERGNGEHRAPGKLLEEALEEAGLSVRGFAKIWAAEVARPRGAEPSSREIESRRRQLRKWISGDTPRISNESAEELARRLGKPADYFKTPPKPRARRREELAELRDQVADIQTRLDQLGAVRTGLDELRSRLDGIEAVVAEVREVRRPRQARGGSQR